MIERNWHGCYNESWKGVIVDDAFAHPAKYSRALIRRIYEHAFAMGWLVAGDLVVDPFGGVALGALEAMRRGLHWVGMELEQPFNDMGLGCDCTGISKADWVRFQGRWDKARYLNDRYWCPRCLSQAKMITDQLFQAMLFGSRQQTACYRRNSGKIPMTEPHHYQGNIELWREVGLPGTARLVQGDSRELARIVGEARCCVSSPPYVHRSYEGMSKSFAEWREMQGRSNDQPGAQGVVKGYGNAVGQLAGMPEGDFCAAISSPPYAEGCAHTGGTTANTTGQGGPIEFVDYGTAPGQLGAMPAGEFAAAVSSPPFEECHSIVPIEGHSRQVTSERVKGIIRYGATAGQLGQDSGPTFWTAARAIVAQTYQVLRPGAVAIWVTKSFVRNKQRVDFPGQWLQLCESCGFEPLEWIRAWLVEDNGTQYGLFGDDERLVKERKSFFRRLAEKKGSPSIDYEVVVVTMKPPRSESEG
jgi:hypothetical protein